MEFPVLQRYEQKGWHNLWLKNQTLWDRGDVKGGMFLDPARQRFVVVSIDPAGGGKSSDEVFVVFLVSEGEFGLLTGRIVSGHNQRYPYSMVPLVFILALLKLLRDVRALLQEAHGRWLLRRTPFVMPPIIVLIENNFAYGAAI